MDWEFVLRWADAEGISVLGGHLCEDVVAHAAATAVAVHLVAQVPADKVKAVAAVVAALADVAGVVCRASWLFLESSLPEP